MPPPPHTTPLLSESEPGESPELPLLLLQFSPLCAPLDSLGHCWVLMRAGGRESQGLCGAAAGIGQRAPELLPGQRYLAAPAEHWAGFLPSSPLASMHPDIIGVL